MSAAKMNEKKAKGQYYTTNCDYILNGFAPPSDPCRIIEPFAGKGDLLKWLVDQGHAEPVEAYDIAPQTTDYTVVQRDTLLDPPDYTDAWILTNPPYLARNKSENKAIFDHYDTNDLYKCFLDSIGSNARGGVIIIPAGFFFSPRDIDVRCRNRFLTQYSVQRVRYFEEQVFPDTTTTVVAFEFERSVVPLKEQSVEWISLPSGATQIFQLSAINDWIIGGDIYRLPVPPGVKVRRWVEGSKLQEGEQITALTLCALDSGRQDARIRLDFRPGYVYPAKESSRTFATLCLRGAVLTLEQQQELCEKFNAFLEKKRVETWSLFLPQYRESKEYARKRIPFELAYLIVLHLLLN